MALVFLRVYPTYEVLAFFFSLHKANAQRGVVEVLATLEAHTVFVCERPAEERKKLRSVQAVMDAFPDVRLVIDAKELMPKNSASSGLAATMRAATAVKSLSTLARRRPILSKHKWLWPRTACFSRSAEAFRVRCMT